MGGGTSLLTTILMGDLEGMEEVMGGISHHHRITDGDLLPVTTLMAGVMSNQAIIIVGLHLTNHRGLGVSPLSIIPGDIHLPRIRMMVGVAPSSIVQTTMR